MFKKPSLPEEEHSQEACAPRGIFQIPVRERLATRRRELFNGLERTTPRSGEQKRSPVRLMLKIGDSGKKPKRVRKK